MKHNLLSTEQLQFKRNTANMTNTQPNPEQEKQQKNKYDKHATKSWTRKRKKQQQPTPDKANEKTNIYGKEIHPLPKHKKTTSET